MSVSSRKRVARISSLPASMRDRSSSSLINRSSRSPFSLTRNRYWRGRSSSGPVMPSSRLSAAPMIEVSGVRSSCETLETNSDFKSESSFSFCAAWCSRSYASACSSATPSSAAICDSTSTSVAEKASRLRLPRLKVPITSSPTTSGSTISRRIAVMLRVSSSTRLNGTSKTAGWWCSSTSEKRESNWCCASTSTIVLLSRFSDVLERRQPAVFDVPFSRVEDTLSMTAIRREIVLPLVVGDEVIGTFNLGSRSRDAFSATEVEVLSQIAAELGVALLQAEAYEREHQAAQKRRSSPI